MRRDAGGFTFIEMMIAVALLGVLLAIAIPTYQRHVLSAKVSRAETDIMFVATKINQYITLNDVPPPDLVTIGADTMLDPWGNPYQYLSFNGLKGKGKVRKDKSLNPINTQYDLYSMGADGGSVPPLTAPVSKDDVILARDGNFIGLASDF